MERRKHYQARRAHADGWEVEKRFNPECWEKSPTPTFLADEYRIVPDADGWLPWYATEDSECPVDTGDLVEVECENGAKHTGHARRLQWSLCWIQSENIVRYRVVQQAEIDPYAELKAAAKDPTKQVRLQYLDWRDAGEVVWKWDRPADEYEIRDKPKTRKVKLLAYLTKGGSLSWYTKHPNLDGWRRVPSEDKEVEVEE